MNKVKQRTDAAGKFLPENHCPTCGYKINAATIGPGQGDYRPKVGDLSVCIKCGEALEFGEGMTLKLATLESMLLLDASGRDIIGRAQELIRKKRMFEK